MTAGVHLEVLSPGAYASVQDRGRRGFRRIGVPWAGVIDPGLMRIANALVGNVPEAPVIECFDGGLQLVAREGAVRVAVAGPARLELERTGERNPLAPWRSVVLAEGDILRLRQMEGSRIAVVAVQGIALPQVMGSASTYARAGLGGVDGRTLVAGACLPAVAAGTGEDRVLPRPPALADSPLRVVLGPQADHFGAEALDAFLGGSYRVTAEADRMGVRLEGPVLSHLGPREIISDATVPGSIQVPGNGQPIVLLADAQTAGGYPKIATVIGSDIPRLAACRPGQTIRFTAVGAVEGEDIARATETATRALLASVTRLSVTGIDEAALYLSNLVSGVVHALSPDYRTLGADND